MFSNCLTGKTINYQWDDWGFEATAKPLLQQPLGRGFQICTLLLLATQGCPDDS